MKTIFTIIIGLWAASFAFAESSVSNLVMQLRSLTAVEGPAVYYAGVPGRFSLLVPYFENWASDDEVVAMLTDKSPIVRIMGYQCALTRKKLKIDGQMQSLENDSAVVDYYPFGCCGSKVTVGKIVCELKKDPKLLVATPKVLGQTNRTGTNRTGPIGQGQVL